MPVKKQAPKKGKAGGKRPGTEKRYTPAQRLRQRQVAMEYYLNGGTLAETAKKLSISVQTASARLNEAIDEMRPHADYERYRALHLIDNQIARKPLRQVILNWEPLKTVWTMSPSGERFSYEESNIDELVKAVSTLMKVNEREAKLLLLDKAPAPSDGLGDLTTEEEIELFTVYMNEILSDDKLEAFLESVAK